MLIAVVATLIVQQAVGTLSRSPPPKTEAEAPASGATPDHAAPRAPELRDVRSGAVAPSHRAAAPS